MTSAYYFGFEDLRTCIIYYKLMALFGYLNSVGVGTGLYLTLQF